MWDCCDAGGAIINGDTWIGRRHVIVNTAPLLVMIVELGILSILRRERFWLVRCVVAPTGANLLDSD